MARLGALYSVLDLVGGFAVTGTMKGLLVCLALLLASSAVLRSSFVAAGEQDRERIERAWSRLDLPVADLQTERTWVWGPEPITSVLGPESNLAPAGVHGAIYYEKARMQFPAKASNDDLPELPANGRLVAEMLSGSVQLAVRQFTQHLESEINVVGDAGDPDGITYDALSDLRTSAPFDEGMTLDTMLLPDGALETVPELAEHGVTAGVLDSATNHRVASVFWEFLSSSGTVWDGESYVDGPLFTEPLALTGRPLTEAYWVRALVDGAYREVLLQCFESRCMTFTPANPEGWRVEFNNAGAHYLEWRAGFDGEVDPGEPELPIATFDTGDDPSPTITLEVAATQATRQCGLMHRTEMPADQGMLFVFDDYAFGGFWNCNTFIPLTLAWIDADGTILGFSDMEAQTPGEPQNPETTYPPAPYRYVIEANQGWFAEHGIEPGDRVDLSAALAVGDTSPDTLCQQLGLECG